ncbi:hypothetical protein ACO1O0_008738 [Amphichorda felina]
MVSKIVELAEAILNNTSAIDTYLKENSLPSPSFDIDGPVNFGIRSEHVEASRIKVIEASIELADLLHGPMNFLRPLESGAPLEAISKWDIAAKIPVGETVSYADLAQQCDVHETDMQRILRLASRLLAEEPLLRQGLWLLAEDTFSSSSCIVRALEKFKKGQEPNHTGFQVAHDTELSAYDYMESHPEYAHRFGMAQNSYASFPNRPAITESRMTLNGAFDWSSVKSGLVVDLGGSHGTDAVHIATNNPELRVMIQDLPTQLEGAETKLPKDLLDSGRISFMSHNFFTPQTVSADVYLIKQCLHNWPDHYCVEIFKNQVPALKPGARFVIVDSAAPPPGEMTLMDDRTVRAFDILMLAKARGREREECEWLKILKEADQRFDIVSRRRFNTKGDFGPFTGIIEVVFNAQAE